MSSSSVHVKGSARRRLPKAASPWPQCSANSHRSAARPAIRGAHLSAVIAFATTGSCLPLSLVSNLARQPSAIDPTDGFSKQAAVASSNSRFLRFSAGVMRASLHSRLAKDWQDRRIRGVCQCFGLRVPDFQLTLGQFVKLGRYVAQRGVHAHVEEVAKRRMVNRPPALTLALQGVEERSLPENEVLRLLLRPLRAADIFPTFGCG